jgi:hypothetical protein
MNNETVGCTSGLISTPIILSRLDITAVLSGEHPVGYITVDRMEMKPVDHRQAPAGPENGAVDELQAYNDHKRKPKKTKEEQGLRIEKNSQFLKALRLTCCWCL